MLYHDFTTIPNDDIIEGINQKQKNAFEQVYLILRKDMVYYANRLFREMDMDGEDIIQDIFVAIWQKPGLVFRNGYELKAYVYASVRNRLKNHIRHSSYSENYRRAYLAEYAAVTDMAETEIIAVISHYEKLLSSECVRVFRMHLEGWSVKEIAERLDKSESTVYHQRAEIFKILRKKISRSDLYLLMTILHNNSEYHYIPHGYVDEKMKTSAADGNYIPSVAEDSDAN